jgi:hypothetical protein
VNARLVGVALIVLAVDLCLLSMMMRDAVAEQDIQRARLTALRDVIDDHLLSGISAHQHEAVTVGN